MSTSSNPPQQPNLDLYPSALVYTFNALPRREQLPSSSNVPNHWHMSIRHVPLHPPGHVLFLVSPAARYIHVQGPLPPTYASATTTEVEKARILSVLLLKAFNGGLGVKEEDRRDESGVVTVGRPWSLVCDDREMAIKVGEALKSLGVQAPEEVGVAGDEENAIAEEEWGRFWGKLQDRCAGGLGRE